METRIMETTLISARDLKNTSMFSKTKAFAVAWISNKQKCRQWTAVDKDNGTDPTWNQVMNFILDEADLHQGRLLLEIVIYRNGTFGDKEIGRVSIPLNEFLKPAGGKKGGSTSAQFASYQVRKPSGKPKGVLNLSVKFAEKAGIERPQVATDSYGTVKPEAVSPYPVYLPAGWSSYPPLYSLENNQYSPPTPPPQAIYPPPPPYYQGYQAPPPCYQGCPPCQDYSPYQDYPPFQGYPSYQGYPPIVPAA
jgi:hypothetical protein